MKHLSILTLTIIALSSFMATTVQADSPHFVRGPTASLDTQTGDYCVTFKEAGLGNLPITYVITAQTADFTFQCFTRHGNEPQGDPNHISVSNLSAQTTIQPHNGQITGTLCLSPQQDGAHCQGRGLVLKLIHVAYLNVQLCDVSNNVCANAASLSGDIVPPIPFP